MSRCLLGGLLAAAALGLAEGRTAAEEAGHGRGLSEGNIQRLMLVDMKDVADWHNGSPDETKISSSDKHTEGDRASLKFANVVDHTKGEKNYPIGWPRTGKDMAKVEATDWSEYDFFECRIYAETSRKSLPGTPLGVGFYHTGQKRSSSFPLKEVAGDRWTKIVIPISELIDPADVQRVQFNISESSYKHGDRVDFYITDMALVQLIRPTIAEFALDRKLLYATDHRITALYTLMGRMGLGDVRAELAIGRADQQPAAKVVGNASRQGELPLAIPGPLVPGPYWGGLTLRDAEGNVVDRARLEFRVIEGPF
ncbi:MAG: hypothetical protein HQ582_03890 [Planctomycetes bacterium]|nr:hypothetical protein [Planctomycetota bacterium]